MSTEDKVQHLKKVIAGSVLQLVKSDPSITEYRVVEIMLTHYLIDGPDHEANSLLKPFIEAFARATYYEVAVQRRLKELPADAAGAYSWKSLVA
jgi:hypothetical protein